MKKISPLRVHLAKLLPWFFLGTILFACSGLFVPMSKTQPEQARSADSFINSMGVAVHINYTDTAYGNYDLIKSRLQELGIRHIRDGVNPSDTNTQQKFNDLATLGIKSTLVMDPRGVVPSDAINIARAVAPSIEAVEGANEWDIQPILTYKGQTFPDGIRLFQTELYELIKNTPDTANLDVLSPSMAFPENANQLANIPCDVGVMHSYAGGGLPSDQLDTRWLPNTRRMCGDKPIIATESGWHNALNDPGSPQRGVSEEASAKYVPRLYLEYFNRNIKRAFIYELINLRPEEKQDSNFGLLRSDGSEKPAFIAVKNLISLLQDTGENLPLESLDYTITGDTNNVHHTILQKSDHRFYLILWQEVLSYNTQSKTDISVPEVPATLIFNTPIAQIAAYLPLNSTQPIWQQTEPKTVQLSIPDHPLVIELLPAKIS